METHVFREFFDRDLSETERATCDPPPSAAGATRRLLTDVSRAVSAARRRSLNRELVNKAILSRYVEHDGEAGGREKERKQKKPPPAHVSCQ